VRGVHITYADLAQHRQCIDNSVIFKSGFPQFESLLAAA